MFPPVKSPKYPLNEAEWTLESVWMLFGEKKISARDSTVVPQLVQFTVTIMITVSGSILGNLLLTEFIQHLERMGKGNWLKYFTRTHQVLEEEHTERWKDQFTVKLGS